MTQYTEQKDVEYINNDNVELEISSVKSIFKVG